MVTKATPHYKLWTGDWTDDEGTLTQNEIRRAIHYLWHPDPEVCKDLWPRQAAGQFNIGFIKRYGVRKLVERIPADYNPNEHRWSAYKPLLNPERKCPQCRGAGGWGVPIPGRTDKWEVCPCILPKD